MSNPQQVAAPEQQGATPIPNRDDMAFFSSAAITFGAMMAMMAAELNAMNGMAKLAILTTGARTTAILSTADSTQSMYNDDASSLTQQSYEQWASVGSSIAQAGMGCGGIFATGRASLRASDMDKLNTQTNGFRSNSNISIGNFDEITGRPTLEGIAAQRIKSQLLGAGRGNGDGISADDYRTIMSQGGVEDTVVNGQVTKNGYDLRRLTNPNITENGTTGAVTLKQVFEASDETEVADMQSGIGKGVKKANKQVAIKHTEIQGYVQIGNAMAQAGSGGPTAQFKLQEAQYTRDKGAEALVQTLSQNAVAMYQEAQKSQTDQTEKNSNLAGQTLQTISQLVQVDTKNGKIKM